MAVFEVQGPDGKIYEVDAPDEQSAIDAISGDAKQSKPERKVIATTDDGGRVYQLPDGSLNFVSPGQSITDQKKIAEILKGAKPVDLVQRDFDEQRINEHPIAARANEVVRGTPFIGSYADEAVGLVSPDAAENMRRSTASMQRQKPKETMGLNVLGGIAGSIPMALAAAPSVMGALPQSRALAGLTGLLGGGVAGGTEGLIYGSGEGTTGPERWSNAKRDGTTGAAFGAALGAVSPFLGMAIRSGLAKLKGTDVDAIAKKFKISKNAARVVKEHLDADQLDEAVSVLRAAGDDSMLAEATAGSRSLTDAVAARGGPAANVVSDAIEGRVANANSQFTSVADDVLGPPPQGLLTAADEVAQRTATARTNAYTNAFGTPINYASDAGRAVDDVIARTPPKVVMDAVEAANEVMIARKMPRNMHILAEIADDGTVRFSEKLNVQQLDQLKKSLQSTARKNVDTFGRLDDKGTLYDGLASELRDAVGDAAIAPDGSKPYLEAVQIGGDKIRETNALELGRNLLRTKTTRDDVIRQMVRASADEKAGLRAGLRLAIHEKMEDVRRIVSDPNIEARQVKAAFAELSSGNARTKVKAVLGPEEAAKLLDEVDRLERGFVLKASVAENSRTARRTIVNKTIDDVTDRNVIKTLEAGEIPQAAKAAVQLLTGEDAAALAFRRSDVAKEIATFLTGKRGRSAEAALRYVNTVMSGQKLTEAQAKFVADQLVVSGFFASGDQGREFVDPHIPRFFE